MPRIKEIDDIINSSEPTTTLQSGVELNDYQQRFPNRDEWNWEHSLAPVTNTFKQVGEMGGGLEFLWNSLGGIGGMLSGKGGNLPIDRNTPAQIGRGIVEGTLQNWGQQEAANQIRQTFPNNPNSRLLSLDPIFQGGSDADYMKVLSQLKPKAALQSLVANPLNVFDIIGLGKLTGAIKGLEGAKATTNVIRNTEEVAKVNKMIQEAKAAGTGLDTARYAMRKQGGMLGGLANSNSTKFNVADSIPITYTKSGTKFSQMGTVGNRIDRVLGSPYDFPAKSLAKTAKLGTFERGLNNIATTAKKTFLSLPDWVTTNRVGNTLMKAVDENPYEMIKGYIKYAQKAHRNLIPEEITKGLFNATQTEVKPAKTVFGKIAQKMPNPMFSVEAPMEAADRGSNFLNQLDRIAKETGLTPKQIVGNEALRREALARTTRAMGDFTSPTILNNRASLVDLFIKWQRAISKAAINTQIEKPGRSAVLKGLGSYNANLAKKQEEKINEMGFKVPEHMKYAAVSGTDQKGRPELYTEQRALPTSTLKDLANLGLHYNDLTNLSQVISNPVFNFFRDLTGQNWYGGNATSPNIVEDYRGKRYYRNPQGGIEPLPNDRLPERELNNYLLTEIFKSFGGAAPGALRKYQQVKGQTSYDTNAFKVNPNLTKRQKGIIESLFGVGSYGSATKLPQVDEEAVKKIFENADKGKLYTPKTKKKKKKKTLLESQGLI
jgi:hypothetical protein